MVNNRGWIKLHRKILNNPVFQDPYLFKLWMYCLLKASHSKHEQLVGKEIITLNEGQFIWGRIEATKELNRGTRPKEQKSESTWERHLKLLEELKMLNRETNNKYTVVTIEKWGFYQELNNESEQQMNSTRTSNEHQMNTNKNVKNDKNVKKKDKRYSRKQVYDDSSVYYKLAIYFYEQIKNNNPNHKKPNLQNWADDISKMIELDKRTEKQVKYLMQWVQQDEFEMVNVMSPAKLRKRFDNLIMKVKREKQQLPANVTPIDDKKRKYNYGF